MTRDIDSIKITKKYIIFLPNCLSACQVTKLLFLWVHSPLCLAIAIFLIILFPVFLKACFLITRKTQDNDLETNETKQKSEKKSIFQTSLTFLYFFSPVLSWRKVTRETLKNLLCVFSTNNFFTLAYRLSTGLSLYFPSCLGWFASCLPPASHHHSTRMKLKSKPDGWDDAERERKWNKSAFCTFVVMLVL